MSWTQANSDIVHPADQSIEDSARLICCGKELPIGLFMQIGSSIAKKSDGFIYRKSLQDVTNEDRAAAMVIGCRCISVGDIASPAATHEDLGADFLRSIEQHNGFPGTPLRCENGCRYPCCSTADNNDIHLCHGAAHTECPAANAISIIEAPDKGCPETEKIRGHGTEVVIMTTT